MTDQNVDLTDCKHETIHIPGLIQPHGVLLVLQEPDFTIIQISSNTLDLINISPDELLGKTLLTLLNPQQIAAIRQCLSEDFDHVNPLEISIERTTKVLLFDGIVHRQNELIFLELEPKQESEKADFFELYRHFKGMITKIQKAPTLLKCPRM